MVTHKVESGEYKGYQQYMMVDDCINHWFKLNNADYSLYTNVMNMKTRRINYEHSGWVAKTYHINLNKW